MGRHPPGWAGLRGSEVEDEGAWAGGGWRRGARRDDAGGWRRATRTLCCGFPSNKRKELSITIRQPRHADFLALRKPLAHTSTPKQNFNSTRNKKKTMDAAKAKEVAAGAAAAGQKAVQDLLAHPQIQQAAAKVS